MHRHLNALCVFVMSLVTMSAYAQAEGGVRSIRLVTDASRSAVQQDFATAAILITLAPGWKTYWKTPGQFGIPLSLTLHDSKNVRNVDIHWPVPTRFTNVEMPETSTVGYADTVILPIKIWRHTPGRKSQFSADVSLGVCADVCILFEAQLAYSEEREPEDPGAEAKRIAAALNSLPRENSAADGKLRILEVAASGDHAGLLVTVCDAQTGGRPWDLFVAATDTASFSSPPREVSRNGHLRVIRAVVDENTLSGTSTPPPVGASLDIVYASAGDAVSANKTVKDRFDGNLGC